MSGLFTVLKQIPRQLHLLRRYLVSRGFGPSQVFGCRMIPRHETLFGVYVVFLFCSLFGFTFPFFEGLCLG